ncbi:MAG TPA: amino acid permease [Gaiellales bacterium]|jgi:APA family basic amino acid/polyamine antiporter|nr:amino acid permease [Gaiellales bacterium]
MARKIPSLGRFLGAPSLYAMAYGEISSSLYYALGLTAIYALSLTPVVFLAAGVLFAFAAAAYAEGGATLSEPGGSSAMARRAWGDLVGFIAGWATVLDFVITVSLSALFLPHYVSGVLGQDPGAVSVRAAAVYAVGILVIMTTVRLARRTEIYTTGVFVAALDLIVQVSLAVLGLALLFSWSALTRNIDVGSVPTWNSLAFSFPIAMIGYTGLEKVSSVAALAKDPERSVPDSVRSSVFTVVIVYAAVATAAASAFPTTPDPTRTAHGTTLLATKWVNAPMLGLAERIGSHGPHWFAVALRIGVGATACAILVLAISTSFSGCGRLAAAMGQHDQLPPVFGRTSRRVLHPPAAILGVGLLSVGFIVVGALYQGQEVITLASLYSFGILIAFMLTQAAVVWLRITEPDLPRPFLMKGNVWIRGRLIPITSVVGTLLAFAAWVIALGTHPGARVVGPLWMVAGVAVYIVVRVRAGLPIIERVDEALPPPEDVTDVAYSTIIVPLERLDAVAEETMAASCRIAVDSGAVVVGVSAIYVPVREPMDTPMLDREREVEEVQELARSLASEYGVEYRSVVSRTRSPGRLIVDAAIEYGAQLIMVGSPYKRRSAASLHEEFFGQTVDFILRKAPCRVIVTHFPAEVAGESAGV